MPAWLSITGGRAAISERNITVHRCILPLFALISLLGCSSRITAENYAKIHVGMNREAVVELLGKPDECSGMTVPILSAEKCSWKSGHSSIAVSFLSGSAVAASADGL